MNFNMLVRGTIKLALSVYLASCRPSNHYPCYLHTSAIFTYTCTCVRYTHVWAIQTHVRAIQTHVLQEIAIVVCIVPAT